MLCMFKKSKEEKDMRIELQFIVKKRELPVDYRRIFISFLKSCISSCGDGKYMSKYYEPGIEKEYSFGVFFEKPQFLQDKIILGTDKVKLVFSSADKLTSFIFYSAFLEKKNKKFPLENGNEMILSKVKEIKKQEISSSQVLVQTASPLCIRKHDPKTRQDFYYSYSNEEFREKFLYVVKRQLENAGFPENYLEGLNIEPIQCKKVIVKHYQYKIECTLGRLMIEGEPTVLQYLLNAGIGSRKSGGFGLLELVSNG